MEEIDQSFFLPNNIKTTQSWDASCAQYVLPSRRVKEHTSPSFSIATSEPPNTPVIISQYSDFLEQFGEISNKEKKEKESKEKEKKEIENILLHDYFYNALIKEIMGSTDPFKYQVPHEKIPTRRNISPSVEFRQATSYLRMIERFGAFKVVSNDT